MGEELRALEEQASELKVEARYHREEKHKEKNLGRQQLQKMQAKVADLEEKLAVTERRGEMRSHEVRLEQRKQLDISMAHGALLARVDALHDELRAAREESQAL